ncbi:hypothetical protein [Trichocoleus sp. FACHB-591]|uniref:hypothetical protein n=1 Tax=Trichocoleus sp. FACHB-591 TaxID=2692872 RepID=UPI001F559F0C|nr:hypothetical protein [Trichocoleus sp. FACHB-591]
MNSNSTILQQAALAVLERSRQRPTPEQVVQALLAVEKANKQQKIRYSLNDITGDWRLCFITGTRKTRQRAGVVLGAGRYVPSLITISLAYAASPLAASPSTATDNASYSTSFETGNVTNRVHLGQLQMALSGPTKLLSKNNILAFDFTRITLQLSKFSLYQGTVRGGETSEAKFYAASVGVEKQAFFNYFLVQEDIIAARGRGGGLALWGRQA